MKEKKQFIIRVTLMKMVYYEGYSNSVFMWSNVVLSVEVFSAVSCRSGVASLTLSGGLGGLHNLLLVSCYDPNSLDHIVSLVLPDFDRTRNFSCRLQLVFFVLCCWKNLSWVSSLCNITNRCFLFSPNDNTTFWAGSFVVWCNWYFLLTLASLPPLVTDYILYNIYFIFCPCPTT